MTADELAREIRSQFGPGDRLAPEAVVAHVCEECMDIAAAFGGQLWPEIAPDIIDQHYQSLPLFAPAAFRQFLPGFLLRGLERSGRSSGANDVAEFTLYTLCPDTVTPWWRERVDGLTDAQSYVVAQWLGHLQGLSGDYFGPPPLEAWEYWEARSVGIPEHRDR